MLAINGILNGEEVIREPDICKWAEWYASHDRHVGKDEVGDQGVSTVFLGIDHGFGSTPQWFETMVFGGLNDEYQERYQTYAEALAGHKRIVESVKSGAKLV